KKVKTKRINWIYIVAGILIAVGLIYWFVYARAKTGNQPAKNGLSAELIRANKLTGDVYYYVEQVEMKKMTKEEAGKFSNPIKEELQSVRSQLSKEELMYNDSIRKVLGNIMVDNVMKWRVENGLIQPEDTNSMQTN
ncbi:MAG TPA: hypothetical protein VMZ69_05265, partial [Saprospiraceae bacterium]|nr:hypothetical protein [Saprospiraceae bacterium]